MTQTCKTCRWWRQDHHAARYQTRSEQSPNEYQIAPVIIAPCVIRSPHPAGWPLVAEDDFCGEWKAKAEAASKPVPLSRNDEDLLSAALIASSTRVNAAETSGFGWQSWNGGECPVDIKTTVFVQYRDPSIPIWSGLAGSLRWNHIGHPADVIAYKIGSAYKLEGRGA